MLSLINTKTRQAFMTSDEARGYLFQQVSQARGAGAKVVYKQGQYVKFFNIETGKQVAHWLIKERL